MDRSLAPAFKASIDFKLPKPEKIKTKSGTSVIYLPHAQIPITKIEFVFAAGKISETRLGLAQFTVSLLDKGAGQKNASQIAELLDYHGAHLELATDSDFASVSLYCLSRHVDTLLPLVLEIISEPTFPEDELNTYRRIFIENLKVSQKKNSYVASTTLRKAIFGNHPYGWSIQQDDIKKISKSEIQNFFTNNYFLQSVFVTGSVEPSSLEQVLEYGFRSNPVITRQPIISQGILNQTTDGPSKDQASIRFGKISLSRNNNGFAELVVLNHLFGGFFGSRLMRNIREDKGLTYGIYSSIHHYQLATTLTVAAEVNLEHVTEAGNEIFKELKNLSSQLSQDELQTAKNHLIGSLQNDNASLFAVIERIKTIEMFQLADTHYEQLIGRIANCTVENLRELASQEFTPESFSSIIVR